MALYPKARYRPVVGLSNDPPIIPIGVILHVRAGTGPSLYPYFNGPSGGIESHMYLTFDGHWEQYRDTTREADAQGDGNSFIINGKRYGFISVETEGGPNGTWTPTQLREIDEFIRWAAKTHGFPLRKAPAWNRSGVGYHSLFDQWNKNAHTCPGPERIKQFNTIVLPLENDDMPNAEDLWDFMVPRPGNTPATAGGQLGSANVNAFRAWQTSLRVLAAVESLTSMLQEVKTTGGTADLDTLRKIAEESSEAAIRKVAAEIGAGA